MATLELALLASSSECGQHSLQEHCFYCLTPSPPLTLSTSPGVVFHECVLVQGESSGLSLELKLTFQLLGNSPGQLPAVDLASAF